MWICPKCEQKFRHTNQTHSCGDKTLSDFLNGKSAATISIFEAFLNAYRRIGDFTLHPAKSRISLANNTRFCSINQLGRNFIDISFTFDELYSDTFCFHKAGAFPDSKIFNHHCRLYDQTDITDEVKRFMQLAYDRDQRKG